MGHARSARELISFVRHNNVGVGGTAVQAATAGAAACGLPNLDRMVFVSGSAWLSG